MTYDLEVAQKRLRDNGERQEHLRNFISGFADRLNGDEDAQGLAFSLFLFTVDVERGVDGFTNAPMKKLPPEVANLMALVLLRRLSDFFPEHLAVETLRAYEEQSA